MTSRTEPGWLRGLSFSSSVALCPGVEYGQRGRGQDHVDRTRDGTEHDHHQEDEAKPVMTLDERKGGQHVAPDVPHFLAHRLRRLDERMLRRLPLIVPPAEHHDHREGNDGDRVRRRIQVETGFIPGPADPLPDRPGDHDTAAHDPRHCRESPDGGECRIRRHQHVLVDQVGDERHLGGVEEDAEEPDEEGRHVRRPDETSRVVKPRDERHDHGAQQVACDHRGALVHPVDERTHERSEDRGRQECHAYLPDLHARGPRFGSRSNQCQQRHVVQPVAELRHRLADREQHELRARQHRGEGRTRRDGQVPVRRHA
jgi:hypothetical protein